MDGPPDKISIFIRKKPALGLKEITDFENLLICHEMDYNKIGYMAVKNTVV
jgi:hypothetical protein